MQLLLRFGLGAICLALVAAPFPVAFVMQHRAELYGPQYDAPPIHMSGGDRDTYQSLARAAERLPHTAPIILSYHDIRPTSSDEPYVVSPQAFANQMAMLDKAGYHTLTADEFVRYSRGGSVPSHSVLLTFDDGTQGLYTYADQILAQHGFNAVSFLITERVSRDQDYYLNWAQVRRMEESGRWDFGSHTANLHSRVQVSASGETASPLTHRRWLGERRKQESMRAFRQRVRADLMESVRDISAHGLPRPRLFAYPFSEEATSSSDPRAGQVASRILDELFAASMTNDSSPTAITRRALAEGPLPRLEIYAGDTAGELFARMREITTIPLGGSGLRQVLHNPANWRTYGGRTASVSFHRGALTFSPNADTYAYAAFGPRRTGDWEDYTFSARATRLLSSSSSTATVSVRVGTPAETTVNVSDDTLSIYVGVDDSRRLVREVALYPAPEHDVSILVRTQHTRVSVDGVTFYTKRVTHSPLNNGGIALASNRGGLEKPYVRYEDLTVKKGGPS